MSRTYYVQYLLRRIDLTIRDLFVCFISLAAILSYPHYNSIFIRNVFLGCFEIQIVQTIFSSYLYL